MFWNRKRKAEPVVRDSEEQAGRKCPHCEADVRFWVPIRYGAVGEVVRAQVVRGEVVLGGVNHGRNEPGWHCKRCLKSFGRAREDRDRFGRPLDGARDPAAHRHPRRGGRQLELLSEPQAA